MISRIFSKKTDGRKRIKYKAVLVTLMILITAGCAKNQEETPSLFLDTFGLESMHPAFLQIDQGAATVLSAADYGELLTDCEDVLLPLVKEDADSVVVTQVQCLYEAELARRVSPIYVLKDLGGGLDASTFMQVKRSVKSTEELSAATEETVFRSIEERFDLPVSGISGLTQSYLFLPAEEKQYAALVFIPRVYRIIGEIEQDKKTLNFEALYPCVNMAGYLDGIFAVAVSDFVETFVDVAQ